MLVKRFEDLQIWKNSRELNKKIYLLTGSALLSQDFGLKDQIRRASVSIMLNIAEGFDSDSSKSFLNFLRYSFRSASEVKASLYIALDLNYINAAQFKDIESELQKIQKMISSLIKHLKK